MIERLKDPEFREAVPYFAVGAAKGVIDYYVRPAFAENKGRVAWGVLAGGVVAYDMLATTTLSEHVDSAIESHPLLTRAAIGVTALHLANIIPSQIDPIHQMFRRIKKA